MIRSFSFPILFLGSRICPAYEAESYASFAVFYLQENSMASSPYPILDLRVGQPDYPTPDFIKEAAHAAIRDDYTTYTPQPGYEDLRETIAQKFIEENNIHAAPDRVVVSCGAKQSLYLIFQRILDPSDEVIVFSPYWFAYPHQIDLAGGKPTWVPLRQEDGFQPDPERVRSAITERTSALLINSPCNPTGAVFGMDSLEFLGNLACEHDLLIVSDEVYERILFDENVHYSVASLSPEFANRTITVNSVSKTHSMTGWRIGYVHFPTTSLAEDVTYLQSMGTSGPCSISQRAALAALTGDQSHTHRMVNDYAARRGLLLDGLERIEGLSCFKPQGTFYLFIDISALSSGRPQDLTFSKATRVTNFLENALSIIVSDGVNFGSDSHVRLSFAAAADILEEAVARMTERMMHLENYRD